MDNEIDKLCVVCGGRSKTKVIHNPDKVKELLSVCKQKSEKGELKAASLYDKLSSLSEDDLARAVYHSECRKPYARTRFTGVCSAKVLCTNSSSSIRGPGRPQKESLAPRPKRVKVDPLVEFCLFKSCSFCTFNSDNSGEIHTCETDAIGLTLLKIKNTTCDDQIRSCVADFFEVGDASALEKKYHRDCMIHAKRSCKKTFGHNVNSNLVSVCDDELVSRVVASLKAEEVINIADVNEAYLDIRSNYGLEVGTDYRKSSRFYYRHVSKV